MLYTRFRAAAQRFPERPALWAKDLLLTYEELSARVEAIRTVVRPAPLVGVLTGDDVDTYAALLAILGSSAGYVPLGVGHPADRNAAIAQDAGLTQILAAQAHPQLETLKAARPELEITLLHDLTSSDAPEPAAESDAPAYLLYTSGSTGRPKGVPISHGNLTAFFDAVNAAYAFSPEDRFLQMFELTFDLSVFSTFAPLTTGGCCYVLPHAGIVYMTIPDVLEAHEITVALMAPSVIAYLQPYFDELAFPDLRLSLFCGEALLHNLVTGWAGCAPLAVIENVYGPTEATIFCTRYPWRESAEVTNGVVAIGRPLPGMEAQITGEGELLLTGAQVTTGYRNDPEQTAQAFTRLPGGRLAYRTGDHVSWSSHNNLLYLGRTDQQVKIDGFRVELGEIECHVRAFAGSEQAVVVAAPNADGRLMLHAFIENFDPAQTADLRAYLKTKLPAYMQPHAVHSIPTLPLNLNGKIDRKALAAQAGA